MRRQRKVNGVSNEDVEGQGRFDEYLQRQGRLFNIWNKIFVVSCVIAVSVDPLFFYIPVINEDRKCIGFDRTSEIMAILSRSATDLLYIVNIILRFYLHNSYQKLGRIKLPTDASELGLYSLAKQLSSQKLERTKSLTGIASRHRWRYFIVDILSILPIPQVVILIMFLKMEASHYLETRTWLNLAVFLQYVPRVVRIYLSWMEFINTGSKYTTSIKVKAAFNLFLYILGSHVLGAFWYFLSVERETACWLTACENHIGCVRSSFNCKKSPRNNAFLNDHCPVNTPDKKVFDFGIFLQVLQSGMLEQTIDFPKKLLYCFWWGLRNVSSFGQNLETSTYIWENCFAICISIYGLLLFLCFIGNLQVYLSSKATKSLTRKEFLSEKKEKMRIKRLQIGEWVFRNKLPRDIKQKIFSKVEHISDKNKGVVDADENLLLLLPPKLRKDITLHLCLPILYKVPMLQNMGKNSGPLICNYLKPVYYNENSYIARAGEALDAMLLITYGTVLITDTTSNDSQKPFYLGKGDFFGEELLVWGFNEGLKASSPELSNLPIGTKTVKTHTKVKAFVLTAKKLKDLVFYKNNGAPVLIQRAWRRRRNRRHCHHYHHQPAQPQSDTLAEDDINLASSSVIVYPSCTMSTVPCDATDQ